MLAGLGQLEHEVFYNMKFKLFGIVWNIMPFVGALWCFAGFTLTGMSLFVNELGWWNVLYAIFVVAYLATAESCSKALTFKNSQEGEI